MKIIKVLGATPKKGTCGKRPDVNQAIYNPMAPPCPFKPHHRGPHAWETDRWKI
jgi:hypothetical protein